MRFLSHFFKRFNPEPKLPATANDIGEYSTNFVIASAFTASCGFSRIRVDWKEGSVLDVDGSQIASVMRVAGIPDASRSAAQCLKWCHFLAPIFEKQLGCRVWVTVGQVWKGDAKIYGPAWGDIKRWCTEGIQLEAMTSSVGFDLHAWLTVETGEIIDPTYLSTLAATLGGPYSQFAGVVIWGREETLIEGHRYFPMAIGNELVESIAAKSCVPLLAARVEELFVYAALLEPIP